MNVGTPVAKAPDQIATGGYMEALLLKLQADVAARKLPRSTMWPNLRMIAGLTLLFLVAYQLGVRSVDSSAGWALSTATKDRLLALNAKIDAQQGQMELQRAHIDRLERINQYSDRYGIPAGLAVAIEDIAMAEGVDPELAFDLVRVESQFEAGAVSAMGAVGYTQLMPATAKLLVPGIKREQLFERDTNLRLGFRFFRSLINHYNGDVRLALLAYNRGPVRVDRLIAQGVDPSNGYARMVLGR